MSPRRAARQPETSRDIADEYTEFNPARGRSSSGRDWVASTSVVTKGSAARN
jgi:hypothetical protein